MDSDKYIKERLEDQITWYSRKSGINKKWFKNLRITEILFAAIIPFLSGQITTEKTYLPIIIGVLAVGIAIIAGFLALYKFQENWLEYRTTSESLKKEKYLFITNTEPYEGEKAFEILVQKVEALISKENTNWAQYMIKLEKEKK